MFSSRSTSTPRRSFLFAAGTAVGVTALGACSGGGESSPATVEYEQGSASLKVELGPEIEGVPYPEGYVGPRARESEQFSDGTTEFSILARSEANLDLATNEHSRYLEEKTGVKVSYSTVPQGTEGAPRVNAIIASGDLPDAFMLGPEWMGGFSKSELYVYGQQGLFMPLDQLIDENAPQLQELFEQNPDLRSYWTSPDGAMYGMPSVNQCYHCASTAVRTFVHRPSLEAAGISEMPATLDDFEQMLHAMKDLGPDFWPMSGRMDHLPFGLVGAAHFDQGIDWIRRDGDTVVYTPTDDSFRDVLRIIKRFVENGLLDPNAFSQDEDQLKRLTMAPEGSRVGVVQALHHPHFLDVEFSDPDARYLEFEPLPPFSGPGGDPIIPWNESHGDAVGLVISSDCEDPATLVRWADFQLGLVPTLSMRLGTQGKHWEWAEEGDTGIDGRPALYRAIPHEESNITWPEFAPHNLMMDVRHGESLNKATSFEDSLYEAGKLYEPFRNSAEDVYLNPFFDSAQSAEVGELRTNLYNAFVQGSSQMALGVLDPSNDDDWAAYLESFSNAGVERYIDILNEADQNRSE